MQYFDRREKIRKFLKKNGYNSILVHGVYDLFYLTGFYGSYGFAVLTKDKAFLLVDGRYHEQAQKTQDKDLEILLFKDIVLDLGDLLQKLKIDTVFFDPDEIKVSLYNRLCENIKKTRFLSLSKSPVKSMRLIKDDDEIKIIREGVSISREIFESVKDKIRPGVTERDVVAKLNYLMYLKSQGNSFDTIVLSGKKTSLPHGAPGNNKINEKDAVLIDYGIKWKNYCTDHTRVVFLGKSKLEKYYKILKEAFKKALSYVKPGVEIGKIDRAVREFLKKYDLERYFVHSTGHGIGLEVHEYPVVNFKNKDRLKKGMIFTIEPGLYFPNEGGVRYEEMILVTKDGFDVL